MGGTYLTDTTFATMDQCLAFMNTLPLADPCPFPERDNTTACRQLHAFSSFFLPNIHCQHVRPDSAVCVDTCKPACDSCDPHATCVATFPTIYAPVFVCQCNNGYVGNGLTCAPKPCSYGNCPAMYGSYDCSSGLCMCTQTFTQVPTAPNGQAICTCPAPATVFYNDSASPSYPVCVPKGRCMNGETWQCQGQTYTEVKCLPVGNTYTLFDACVCNPGFQGGYEYPCTCLPGNSIKSSTIYAGDVCLAPGQCTDNWHCAWPLHCNFPAGQVFGTCVN